MNRRARDDDFPCSTAGSTRISRQPEPFQTPAETGQVADEGTRGALQRLRPGRRLRCRHLEPLSPAPRTRRPPPPPLSILCRVSPPRGAARLRHKQRLSRPQTGPACPSRSLEAGVSPCKCLPCSFQTWASCTQDGNLRSDRGLLVAGASESRADVSREHSQTALFTGRVLSHHPTRCKDAFRCTLISHGPPNCISSTSAQYCSQRC